MQTTLKALNALAKAPRAAWKLLRLGTPGRCLARGVRRRALPQRLFQDTPRRVTLSTLRLANGCITQAFLVRLGGRAKAWTAAS